MNNAKHLLWITTGATFFSSSIFHICYLTHPGTERFLLSYFLFNGVLTFSLFRPKKQALLQTIFQLKASSLALIGNHL